MNYKLVVALILVAGLSWAKCGEGCEEHSGVCACEAKVYKAEPVDAASDEKVPEDKMPSYQREGIVADMPQSLIAADQKLDAEKAAADLEGKRAAGIVK